MNRGPSFDASLSDEETVEFSEEGTSNSAQGGLKDYTSFVRIWQMMIILHLRRRSCCPVNTSLVRTNLRHFGWSVKELIKNIIYRSSLKLVWVKQVSHFLFFIYLEKETNGENVGKSWCINEFKMAAVDGWNAEEYGWKKSTIWMELQLCIQRFQALPAVLISVEEEEEFFHTALTQDKIKAMLHYIRDWLNFWRKKPLLTDRRPCPKSGVPLYKEINGAYDYNFKAKQMKCSSQDVNFLR